MNVKTKIVYVVHQSITLKLLKYQFEYASTPCFSAFLKIKAVKLNQRRKVDFVEYIPITSYYLNLQFPHNFHDLNFVYLLISIL